MITPLLSLDGLAYDAGGRYDDWFRKAEYDDWSGDADSPVHWFGRLSVIDTDVDGPPQGTHWFVLCDSFGFYYAWQGSAERVQEVFDAYGDAYSEWLESDNSEMNY